MPFDFISFLKYHNIHHIFEGKNVADGNVNIKCPFCGFGDPSEHMGIELDTGVWGCWRDASHRGRNPAKLIRAIIGCSWDEAQAIVDSSKVAVPVGVDSLLEQAQALGNTEPKSTLEALEYHGSFREINKRGPYERFWEYIKSRGFGENYIRNICDNYGLKCVLTGQWKFRIIFPFLFEDKLIGWTGRAIGKAELRYMNHPPGDVTKNIIYNHDRVRNGGNILVITEGPLDCIRIDYFGEGSDIQAVATLGLSITEAQIVILIRLGRKFKKVLILMDANAEVQALRLSTRLSMINPIIGRLPDGISDPAELPIGAIHQVVFGACKK